MEPRAQNTSSDSSTSDSSTSDSSTTGSTPVPFAWKRKQGQMALCDMLGEEAPTMILCAAEAENGPVLLVRAAGEPSTRLQADHPTARYLAASASYCSGLELGKLEASVEEGNTAKATIRKMMERFQEIDKELRRVRTERNLLGNAAKEFADEPSIGEVLKQVRRSMVRAGEAQAGEAQAGEAQAGGAQAGGAPAGEAQPTSASR